MPIAPILKIEKNAYWQIKIFTASKQCKRTQIMILTLRRALHELGIRPRIEIIGDITQMADANVRFLPALQVNGTMILQGGVLPVRRLKKRLKPFLTTAKA